MRTILLFVSVLVVTGSISAQDQSKKDQPDKKAGAKTDPAVSTPTTTVSPSTNKGDGANPTPEEQGYTRKLVNGKEVYIKESGQMIFYYEPRK